jgi:transposase
VVADQEGGLILTGGPVQVRGEAPCGVRRVQPGLVQRPAPQALRSALRRLQRASRAYSRKAQGSANRRKHAAQIARIHARVAGVRADALHKATTGLARRYETVWPRT